MNYIDAIINKRARIEYYDHNDPFGELLPRDGGIKKRYVTDNVNDWYLFKIDEPFQYEGKLQEYFLIRSKWEGELISDKEQCAVFILLVPDMKLLANQKINAEDFEHVAWGFATII